MIKAIVIELSNKNNPIHIPPMSISSTPKYNVLSPPIFLIENGLISFPIKPPAPTIASEEEDDDHYSFEVSVVVVVAAAAVIGMCACVRVWGLYVRMSSPPRIYKSPVPTSSI